MSRWVALLSGLLCLSLAANVYLFWKTSAIANSPAEEQRSAVAKPQLQNRVATPASPDVSRDNAVVPTQDIGGLIDQGRLIEARNALQVALRADPQNTALLLLEARVVIQTESIGSALLHLYDLLDIALDEEQYNWVNTQINALSLDTIHTLMDVKSWDILSAFLEPLWQYAPDNRTYILALAEAYAHQRLAAPMENILASILPEDPHVARIRALLTAANAAANRNNAPSPAPATETDMSPRTGERLTAVPLRRQGDHFIVATRFDSADMNLMIDTGASTTVLTERAFARLPDTSQREFVGEFRINTAGGSVDAPLFRIREMRLGPYALRELAVVVLPMDNFRQADGLLGMNVLREFDFRIDQQNAQLYLTP